MLQHNDRVRLLIASALALAVISVDPEASAQQDSGSADELLAEGYRLYSEDLEFEQAAEAFAEVVGTPGSTRAQRLEALEYLTACRWALGEQQGARDAIRALLEIDREGRLHDPSLPPDLLAVVEEIRDSLPPPEPEVPETPRFGGTASGGHDDERPPGVGGSGVGGPTLEDMYPDRPARPWYRTWWFWTATIAVVAVGVTTAAVLAAPSGEAAPPNGSLDPGVVQLPCVGLPF